MTMLLTIALLAAAATPLYWTGGQIQCLRPVTITPLADLAVPAQTFPAQDVRGRVRTGSQIQINFAGASLSDFINTVGPMFSISPVQIDPDVHGSVTIRGTGPVSRQCVRRIFEGILHNNGAALRKSGDSYRVVSLASAGETGSEVLSAPEPPKREPVAVSADVQQSRLICWVEPVYPEMARRAGVSGETLLQVTINEQGEVAKVLVIRSGHPLLQLAAVDAVKLWCYSPTYVDGAAVPVVTTVTVPFKLRTPLK
jgi:TonB family protein